MWITEGDSEVPDTDCVDSLSALMCGHLLSVAV